MGIETWRREELSHLHSHNFWLYLVLMAETLLNYVTKRRNRSSDSSPDGRVESPEAKKAKNAVNLEILAANSEHAGDASEEDSDIVLAALELTDDLSGILKGILEKLNKLDTIERAVKKIEGSLVKLEERTTKLEALEKTAREDIDNLKAKHAIIEKKQNDTKDALDKKIKGLDGKIAELADKERKISQTLDDLNTKDLYLEAYSRRENIKFNKIKEWSIHPNESENTEEVLRFFLEKQLGYQSARSVEIQRVHRLGKKTEDGGARPILARFLGVFVISHKDILSESESFYKDLYASKIDNSVNFDFFQQANETFLTPDDQQVCGGLLTKTECKEALKSMNADKTAGTDGLPAEFYKAFWDDISTHLLSALNFAYESGCLSITQRRGIIKLIPKKSIEPF